MDWNTWRSAPFHEEAGADEGASNSGGTTCASGTTAGLDGSPVELIASTARDAHNMLVHIGPRSATTGLGSSVSIMIGASLAEKYLIQDLLVTAIHNDERAVASYSIPIFVPAGSRLSCQCNDNSTSAINCDVSVCLQEGSAFPSAPFQRMEPLNSGFGFGTSLDPGTSADTKPATWTQLDASAAGNVKAIVVFLHQDNATMGDDNWLVDIAIGASSSESVLVPNLRASAGATKDGMLPFGGLGPFPCAYPAGTRISARAQSSDVSANDRKIYIQVYAFY
jgi:hypothetical protein